jgi:RNA polymerase sigma-70 factor (ECF subfamily)
VRNKALNRLGQRRETEARLEEGVAGDVEQVIARQQLLAGLSRLSEVQREVVLLHDLESWTHGEIASALDITEVNSRQHLFVARKAMREFLEEAEHE